MTLKEHFRTNITLAYPVMLSQMGHILVSVADSMMVGRLGTVPLASVSLANSVFSVIMLFGLGVSYGMTPLIASADGANDKRMGAKFFKHGVYLNSALGVVLLVIGLVVGEGLILLDQDPEVLAGALPYFNTLVFSLVPLMVFQAFRQFAEGLSMTRQAMYISVSGNALNVFFNYGLIYGELGMPELGLVGAGWASLISRVIMAIAMATFVLTYKPLRRYVVLWSKIKLRPFVMRRILNIGIPSGLQYIFEIGAFSTAAVMVGWIGAEALAAHQIALNLSAITYMIATGISAAGAIRTGNQLGRKDYPTLRTAGMTCFAMAAIMMAFFGAGFIFGNTYLPTWYIEDAVVIEMAGSLLIIAAFFQISDGVQAVGLGVLRGIADVKVPTFVTLFAYWFMAIPLGYVFGIYLDWGAIGIWVALLIGLTLAAIMHLTRFHVLSNRYILRNQ
ncbi:multidrug resistance protein, MATE family [Reichenbachiella faecimaris]|uniref:Multidrug-efflux transporter n=1 Tax=Reichenbachiella faecimaris TaxID=692418 RepID=A0A1W2G838_REIFA|nr:MATE family efflux transporter [Reichenbachiella faecimaris]SMD32850.1 multidrug resistance protein, MATE family [Reichenbachiella faecimaris]